MAKRPNPSQPSMSPATRQRLEAQLGDPNVHDEQNPQFLYSITSIDLLLAITSGLIDPVQLAREQLAGRGLDLDGQWVGFDRASQIWEVQR